MTLKMTAQIAGPENAGPNQAMANHFCKQLCEYQFLQQKVIPDSLH